MWNEEILAGKTIVGIQVASPHVWLEIVGENNDWIEIKVYGDCCSDAFIDVTHLGFTSVKLTGKTQEITFPSKNTTQEHDDVTVVKLIGENNRHITIVHRNSSNGYYGNFLSMNTRGKPSDDAVDGKYWVRDIEST